MKRMILDNKFKAGQPLALRGQTAAWLLGLALAAAAGMNGTSVFAGVYDDFESSTRSGTLWTRDVSFGTGDQAVTNGQVRIFVTPDALGGYAFSSLESVRTWKLQEGRTLEFRADLLSSNDDGAVAYMGFDLGDGTRGYQVWLDKDTLGLLKRANTPLALFFLTNGTPVTVSNVKLVVSMTGVQSDVLLKFRILDNNNAGAVIFEREYRDTPGQDPMQVGPDNPPGNYLGLSGYFQLGLFRDPAYLDPDVTLPPGAMAEVVFDNAEVLEYDVPSAEITNSVLLSWSENTAEEQIVVGADSLASNAVWTPWPEPIFKRQGQLCMTVPVTAQQQFFKLVPGTQFIDDFSDPTEPFATRSPWVPYFWVSGDSSRFSLTVTNSAFRIRTLSPPLDGRIVIAPPGPLADLPVFRDFSASVDILNFTASGFAEFYIFGRGHIPIPFPGDSNGYLGIIHLNPSPAVIGIWDGIGGHSGPPFTYDPAARYRLQFSAVGTKLTVRLVNLTTGQNLEQTLALGTFSQGYVTLAVGSTPGGSYDITLDNFFVTGTKP